MIRSTNISGSSGRRTRVEYWSISANLGPNTFAIEPMANSMQLSRSNATGSVGAIGTTGVVIAGCTGFVIEWGRWPSNSCCRAILRSISCLILSESCKNWSWAALWCCWVTCIVCMRGSFNGCAATSVTGWVAMGEGSGRSKELGLGFGASGRVNLGWPLCRQIGLKLEFEGSWGVDST